VTYLRCTIGRWTIDLDSEEGREAFRLIDTEGVRVFREQPGFVRYRPMVAYHTTTIAVAEWESEELGKPGARRYREWLRSSGIAQKLSLETYDGEVVADSRTTELRKTSLPKLFGNSQPRARRLTIERTMAAYTNASALAQSLS
jgi:hypothetical protein